MGQLNRLARELVERHLPLTWIAGEVSNFKRYDSGHCYFTLKDETAQVDCVMFRQKAALLGWKAADGMQVEVRACATLFEARGKFQLNVEVMRRAGLGALYEAFERLKTKLERGGLFDAARKKALPRFPRTVGIVTSPQGAALRDVLTTLRRRMPPVQVVIYPTPVQGEGAGAKIARTLAMASARSECDVLIVCRGGGNIEDLWAYNDEMLARAIAACALPVISAVGHETDFTIADFVADVRAPTPTAAAQLMCLDSAEAKHQLKALQARMTRSVVRGFENRMQRLDYLSKGLMHPGDRLRHQLQHLAHLANRLCGNGRRYSDARAWALRGLARELVAVCPDISGHERRRTELTRRLADGARARVDSAAVQLAAITSHLKHLNPERVLERGYSIAMTSAGVLVRDAAQIEAGETLSVRFARGSARTEVKKISVDEASDT